MRFSPCPSFVVLFFLLFFYSAESTGAEGGLNLTKIINSAWKQHEKFRATLLDAEKLPFGEPDPSAAQDIQDPSTPASSGGLGATNSSSAPSAAAQRTRWLLQCQGPITTSWKKLMNQYLVTEATRLGHYFPHNTFLVRGPGTGAFRKFLLRGPGVQGVYKFRADFKVGRRFKKFLNETTSSNFTNVTLQVQLFSFLDEGTDNTTMEEAVAALQQYISTLTSDQQSAITFTVVNNYLLQITVTEFPVLLLLTTWLSQNVDVSWFSEKPRPKLVNLYAKHVVQGDDMNTLPIWNHGLHGEGSIIGIGDSGIDYDQCFFRDPNHAVPINSYNPQHRKIVYYNTWQGQGDAAEGHGTHVSGSAAGSVYDPLASADFKSLANWNGMARRAKIAFVQLGNPNLGDSFNIPNSLFTYYDWLRINGHAQLATNSWAFDVTEGYDQPTADTDSYTHQNPDFLVIFSAGNDGGLGPAPPSIAKNVISVGACSNSASAFKPPGYQYEISFSPGGITTTATLAAYGPQDIDPSLFQNAPASLANPRNGCSSISTNLAGKVALLEVGCVFATQTINAQNRGATLVIFLGDDDSYIDPGASTPRETINIASLYVTNSAWTAAVQAAGGNVQAITLGRQLLNEWKVADFSAQGPTSDGRNKPDLLAPGVHITSAKSDGDLSSNQCSQSDLITYDGTSMAAPITAGMAAIVGEYFRKGFYPTGKSTSVQTPSSITADLVKATLIASTVSVEGDRVDNEIVGSPPDKYQGYGRIQLNTVLHFTDSPDAVKLFVQNNIGISTGQTHYYCFKAYSHNTVTGPGSTEKLPALRATLVWTDPPASTTQDVKLINDLNLAITTIGGPYKIWYGNQNNNVGWDNLNNVEQITLRKSAFTVTPASKGQLFLVFVIGANVPQGPQNYALVVNGKILKVPESDCGVASTTAASEDDTAFSTSAISSSQSDSTNWTAHYDGSVEVSTYQYFRVRIPSSSADLKLTLSTPTALNYPEGLAALVSTVVPSLANFEHAVYSNVYVDPSQWSVNIPRSSLPSGGGILNLAVYGFCCSTQSFTIQLQYSLNAV